ncbi:dTDP-4-dehydrorhamnose reductase [Marinovum sp. 2_MG-2023]|uniref:dTDP-4-dehydrorhamnose reductase n=1 Tax=unclassified Marinovum TaxID=2647166 RepID=UPI0026E29C2F|nr:MULTISPECIES: dTDP-4-dehydrorhamnose reductase [unclassified Marinovum]MDO6732130.1 dTDP-4-dehydrorhamnose reductase [Marinovum sp. 2_MG-2023]MDO6781445.1 dTDP-4-dehydrorhamnose reductase [Marinovum sp. 1_MG-2023]
MNVLVFGKTGQVARELQRQSNVTALSRAQADLSDPSACAAAIQHYHPHAVINAAAYTAVDTAETDEAQATRINGDAPGAMARACRDLNIPLVHISTDYVFDGTGDTPWKPTDPTAPQNAYGRSKHAGEQAIRASGCAHVILRTSWVFSAHGNNFVKTMLRLSQSRDALSVVNDQIGGPTPADGIAMSCLSLVQALQSGQGGGTYHYAGQPSTSWECFARETFLLANRAVTVSGIPTRDYPTPAQRPLNSRLDCTDLTRDFGITPPDWRAALAQVIKELTP